MANHRGKPEHQRKTKQKTEVARAASVCRTLIESTTSTKTMKLITLAIRGYLPHTPFSPVVHSSAKLVLALVSTLVLATSMVNAGTNARVLPIGSHAFGHTYGELAAAWWRWALETPASMNPLTDTTGEFAGVNQSGACLVPGR